MVTKVTLDWLPENHLRRLHRLAPLPMNQDPRLASSSLSSSISSSLDTTAIWHNPLTHENRWTRISGNTIVASRTLPTTNSDWQLAATGDVNRDGELDILWRNRISGTSFWWLMEQGQIKGNQWISAVSDMNWQIVGSGDVNRDGNLDILWHHQPSNSLLAWFMPSANPSQTLVSQGYQWLPSSSDRNWTLATTGDVNGDGELDLLWQHRPTGSSQWWQMRQGNWISSTSVTSGTNANQIVTATADFNQDGALDLVVQDVTVGTSNQWLMSSAIGNATISTVERSVVQSNGYLGTSSGWQIAGVMTMSDAGNSLGTAKLMSSGIFSQTQTIGGAGDRSDFYLFGLGSGGTLSASLSGLSADADIRIIADRNNNRQIDAGEILAWPWDRGTTSETLEVFLEAGGYFLEVRSFDDRLTNYQLSTNFTVGGAPARKLDIQLQYDAASQGLDAVTKATIEGAAQYWENVLSGGGSLVPGGVLPITIRLEDLNLKTGGADNFTLAFSGPSVVSDGKQLFLRSAAATLNRRRLGSLDQGSLRTLMIHEFSHALGVGTLWEPLSFRLSDGSIRTIGAKGDSSSLINRSSNLYRADSYAGWAYGELLRDSGRASSVVPTAVPIEPGIFAHWDESIFQSELLTPVATGDQALSTVTLAALRDLGWKVNFGAAQTYQLPATASAPAVTIDFSNLNRPTA